MKFELNFIFEAPETVSEKLSVKAKQNQSLKVDLICAMMHVLNLAFELNRNEIMIPQSLTLGKIKDPLDE